MDNKKLNKRLKKFFTVFVPLGIVMVLLLTIESSTLERVTYFLPLVGVCIYWGWIYFNEKK